ncbi:MAG TPA: vitamin B12 dependent-methionine synthase activation domain-containing protein [Candidatus Dormibacteraeota bacterium]|nr:vitamin B12 dependent-methionine synthase activation domain-containing protein [Candidatus Dormibacteraeota bacterium]
MSQIRVSDPLPVEVSRPMVLLRLGYRRPAQVPERTARLIDEIMEAGRALLRPRAIYGVFDTETREPDVSLVGGALRAASRSLHERLRGCRRAVLFAATIGAEVETWCQGLMQEGQMTRGLLADAFASSAAIALGLEVETVAASLLAEEGLTATKRYAPGYGDWSLESQKPLHALLDAARIGITITEDFLMLPAKSISGVIGGR